MAKQKQPAAIGQKWGKNLGNAGQDMQNGVNAVTEAPGAKAADMADIWLARLQASYDRWKEAVAGVTLQDWQNAMIKKGIPRVTQAAGQQGQGSGQQRMAAFMQQFLPVMQNVSANLPQKQRGNMANALARVQAVIQAAIDFKEQNPGKTWR